MRFTWATTGTGLPAIEDHARRCEEIPIELDGKRAPSVEEEERARMVVEHGRDPSVAPLMRFGDWNGWRRHAGFTQGRHERDHTSPAATADTDACSAEDTGRSHAHRDEPDRALPDAEPSASDLPDGDMTPGRHLSDGDEAGGELAERDEAGGVVSGVKSAHHRRE